MTVTVRPVPKRTYQNGIRPFRPVVPANNIRPYTLKTWRPPVPEPLPPAPLLSPKELLGLGVLVLAQIWGLFASRPRKTVSPGGLEQAIVTGEIGSQGGTINITITAKQRFHSCNVTPSTQCYGEEVDANAATNFRKSYGPGGGGLTVTTEPGNACGINWIEVIADSGGFVFIPGARCTAGQGSLCGDLTRYSVSVAYTNPLGTPSPAPPFPLQPQLLTPSGFALPKAVPQPAPSRVLPPAVAPERPSVPAPVPEGEPSIVPASPGPTAPPTTLPALPSRVRPPLIPGANATRDGAVVPRAPAPIAVTPRDAHYPIPGGAPVLGNGPQPNPLAIAQELGRIEQKLNILSNPNTDGMGDGSDRMALITNILGRLLEFMTSITAGGGYSLSSPCEVDEAGNQVVSVVEYGGATDALGVLSNKIDALAGVMQIHKNLKQPICQQTPAVGENVTVNFVQVD